MKPIFAFLVLAMATLSCSVEEEPQSPVIKRLRASATEFYARLDDVERKIPISNALNRFDEMTRGFYMEEQLVKLRTIRLEPKIGLVKRTLYTDYYLKDNELFLINELEWNQDRTKDRKGYVTWRERNIFIDQDSVVQVLTRTTGGEKLSAFSVIKFDRLIDVTSGYADKKKLAATYTQHFLERYDEFLDMETRIDSTVGKWKDDRVSMSL